MSDEIQAPGADTPEPTLTDTTDWEKRYNDLQPEYTRKSQRLSQLESDPNALIDLVQQYHPDLLDDSDTDEEPEQELDTEDDDDPRWARLEKAEQKLAEIESQREAAEVAGEWNGWETYVKDLASKEGVELTGRDIKALRSDSIQRNGRPVTPDKAQQALKEHLEDLRVYEEKLLERSRKQRKRAPQPPGGGSTATQTPDLDTHQDRVAFMTQRYADLTSD